MARIPARQEREPAVVRITQEEADEGWEGVKTKSSEYAAEAWHDVQLSASEREGKEH